MLWDGGWTNLCNVLKIKELDADFPGGRKGDAVRDCQSEQNISSQADEKTVFE